MSKKVIITPALIESLAGKFSEVLKSWLSKSQINAAIKKNKTEAYKNCCASHDYCDANMTMFEAFTAIVGFEIDLQSDNHLNLWNEAWDLAKANDFAFVKLETV